MRGDIEGAGTIIGKIESKGELCKSSIVEYIVKAVLIHLDDSSEEVQKAVFLCL